ncbi:hypothetical protein [Olleya sp. Bg11-27]|uniref:hypothetical protein n=1 Tax=Olleya sp. Bg11-27 TaxID=2058135 RepID=UPI000C3116D5|nr:hypothetical protein [Olleya sp. Bg11-27]AUC76324.1 hypothetical protein CW732_11885 [Olleya sp. Bg11-27]
MYGVSILKVTLFKTPFALSSSVLSISSPCIFMYSLAVSLIVIFGVDGSLIVVVRTKSGFVLRSGVPLNGSICTFFPFSALSKTMVNLILLSTTSVLAYVNKPDLLLSVM